MQPHELPVQEIDAAGFMTATELGQRWQEAAGGSQSSSPVCWSRLQEESRGHLPFATAGPTQPRCFPALLCACGAQLEPGRAAFAFVAMSHQPGAPHCSWDTTLELHSLALRSQSHSCHSTGPLPPGRAPSGLLWSGRGYAGTGVCSVGSLGHLCGQVCAAGLMASRHGVGVLTVWYGSLAQGAFHNPSLSVPTCGCTGKLFVGFFCYPRAHSETHTEIEAVNLTPGLPVGINYSSRAVARMPNVFL